MELLQGIKKLGKVLTALTELTLTAGTLVAAIKLIADGIFR